MTAQPSSGPTAGRRRGRRRRTQRIWPPVRLDRLGWPLVGLFAVAAAIVFLPQLALIATDEASLFAEAETALARGDLDDAQNAMLRALEKRPGGGEAYLMLARIDIARGDGEAAAARIDRAVRAGLPGEQVHAHLGQARILMEDWRGADEALHAKVAEADLGLANRLLATLAMRRGELAEAYNLLGVARRFDDRNADLWAEYAQYYRLTGQEANARQAARRALQLDAGNIHALIAGAQVAADFRGPQAALPFYDRGLNRAPGDLRLLSLKAKALAEAGRYRDMLDIALTMHEVAPADPTIHYLLAWLAARAGADELAGDLLGRAAVRMGDAPPYLLLAGIVDYRLERYREAATRFETLLRAQPHNDRARQLLGASLLKAGEAEVARRVIAPIADDPPAKDYTRQLSLRIGEETAKTF